MSSMRPSLLPGLIAAVTRNRNRGVNDLALFELGQAYRGDEAGGSVSLGGGRARGFGAAFRRGRHWSGKEEAAGVFDVKADVFAALNALGFDAAKAQIAREAPEWYHPGRSASLKLGPKTVLAHFGDVHPGTLKALDTEAPIAAFEIFLDAIPAEKKKSRTKPALAAADLLAVTRDFAFVVPKGVAAGDVVKAAAGADKALIKEVNVFDVFEGGALQSEGKKSIAIEVTLQPAERDADGQGHRGHRRENRRGRQKGDRRRDQRLRAGRVHAASLPAAAARCSGFPPAGEGTETLRAHQWQPFRQRSRLSQAGAWFPDSSSCKYRIMAGRIFAILLWR